jgi:hypothetical protein
VTFRTNRRWLVLALHGLALVGCGGTSHGGPPSSDGGSSGAEHGGSGSGGSRFPPTGGVTSAAGTGGNAHPGGGSSGVAGTGVAQGGSSAGGVAGAPASAYKECRGNRTISSRDEYLALVAEACTEITGDLTISQDSDLATLPSLTTLTRVNLQLIISDNPSLTSFPALPALELVGTRFIVENNPALTSLPAAPRLASIGTHFIVRNHLALTSLPALPELEVVGDLLVEDNPVLTSLPDLPKLGAVGTLSVARSPLHDLSGLEAVHSVQRLLLSGPIGAPTGLESLTRVDAMTLSELPWLNLAGFHELVVRALNIDGCPNLTSLQGLGSGVSVEHLNLSGNEHMSSLNDLPWGGLKGLYLQELDQLSSLSALSGVVSLRYLTLYLLPTLSNLHGLEQLHDVSEFLTFEGLPQISSLSELGALRSVGQLSLRALGIEDLDGLLSLTRVDGLTITGNPRLSSLAPLSRWPRGVVGKSLEIGTNPLLPQCEVEQLVTSQSPDWGCARCVDNLGGACP